MLSLDSSIYDFPLVALDLETTGAFPVGDEICELAFVRFEGGKVVEEFQSLVKPKQRIPEKTIKIHGITNEMVENSPSIEEIIPHVRKNLDEGIFVAHHAPFDLGFMAYEFEKMGLDLPVMPALCSSLLSRSVFPESKNHRLQTLIQFFELQQGVAHRALDDATACLEVTKRCIEKLNEPSLKKMIGAQGRKLDWKNFSMEQYRRNPVIKPLVEAIEAGKSVKLDYQKAKSVSKARKMIPRGIVRNPDGDYLQAFCLRDKKDKRFYINKIQLVEELSEA
jgi:DNA polymerase-3 subunit epsilon